MATQNRSQAVDLVITRTFDAPRETVFKAWTDPEELVKWWGPKGFTTPFCKIDLRPGGVIHFCMRSPEGQDLWARGVYREIVEPERIVVTDSFADEQGNVVPASHHGMSDEFPLEVLLTLTFEAVDGKTRLTLRHAIPESVPERGGAQVGWSESLDRLADYLAAA